MLLSRKRLHKIKKINNQSMKNKKGGKRKERETEVLERKIKPLI